MRMCERTFVPDYVSSDSNKSTFSVMNNVRICRVIGKITRYYNIDYV